MRTNYFIFPGEVKEDTPQGEEQALCLIRIFKTKTLKQEKTVAEERSRRLRNRSDLFHGDGFGPRDWRRQIKY